MSIRYNPLFSLGWYAHECLKDSASLSVREQKLQEAIHKYAETEIGEPLEEIIDDFNYIIHLGFYDYLRAAPNVLFAYSINNSMPESHVFKPRHDPIVDALYSTLVKLFNLRQNMAGSRILLVTKNNSSHLNWMFHELPHDSMMKRMGALPDLLKENKIHVEIVDAVSNMSTFSAIDFVLEKEGKQLRKSLREYEHGLESTRSSRDTEECSDSGDKTEVGVVPKV